MNELTLSAPAKLNLTLDILRRREDRYHDLKMVMTSVSLCDTVTVRLNDIGLITVSSGAADLPAGEDNLAGKAARAFFNAVGETRGADIVIEKRIPSCAGMGGAAPTPRRCCGHWGRCSALICRERFWRNWDRLWAAMCPTASGAAPSWRRAVASA